MQTYLPKDSANSSGFAEGGGLYALGLIHANHGGDITEYLLGQLKQGGNEPIVTGGCLGLGLAAMGTHRADVYEQLKFTLYQDHADTGESAGIAMGLVMLGSKSAEAIEDMVELAKIEFTDDGDEEEERAYTEIVEYLRISAMMCYTELGRKEQPANQPPKTLH